MMIWKKCQAALYKKVRTKTDSSAGDEEETSVDARTIVLLIIANSRG